MKSEATYLKVSLNKGAAGFWVFAFTLVELIVVITILAILSTIWFVAYNSYLTGARDSNRVWQLASISDWLEIYRTNNDLPQPENSVAVLASGTTIAYQGYMGKNNLETISYSKGWIDPKDDTYFSYYLTADWKYFQLMAYLEDSANEQLVKNNLSWKSNAISYTNRTPTVYGKKLWILTESWTNAPIQEVSSIKTVWLLDIVTTAWTYTANFTDKSTITWTWVVLQTVQNVMKSWWNGMNWPTTCPTWFISVPWDTNFNQAWFCVAQYEMTYTDADTPNSTWWWVDWNTVTYVSWKTIVSMTWKYPIADINQQQAIDACKSMGAWYHLITNNEWMTIARNIEWNGINWTWWTVWNWSIYNWVSHNVTMWCWWASTKALYTLIPRNWATKTWWGLWNTACDSRRQLKLTNWQIIWDFSWNVWEITNRWNTIDGTLYNSWSITIAWCTPNNAWAENTTCTDRKYLSLNSTYDSTRWVWSVYYSVWWNDGRVMIRSCDAWCNALAWIYTTSLWWDQTSFFRTVWFRCAY
jgi:prepilin-type N-terminal cleavage/methylation domain-containing protein